MKIKWVEYHRQGKLPVERRSVLVMIESRQSDFSKQAHKNFGRPGDDPNFKDTAATVAIGYIRIHSNGPFFVVPGVAHKDEEITHWADCLGDNFAAPAWQCKQVIGKPHRQWWRGINMNEAAATYREAVAAAKARASKQSSASAG